MPNALKHKCTVRVHSFVQGDLGCVCGPPVEQQIGGLSGRMQPDILGGSRFLATYDVTGPYIPYFPDKLAGGERGVEEFMEGLRGRGFDVAPVDAAYQE